MKWLDALLGRTRRTEPNLDALFALPGAAVTLEAGVGLRPSGAAAVTFKPASGQAFASTAAELEDLVRLAAEGSQAEVRVTDDDHGYRWIVLDDPDVEDLVTTVHLANRALADQGFGHQLLASVFAFSDADRRPCHLVYLYKRGTFYPFAPRGQQQRDNELELQVRGVLTEELPVEPELGRWFPLWDLPIRP